MDDEADVIPAGLLTCQDRDSWAAQYSKLNAGESIFSITLYGCRGGFRGGGRKLLFLRDSTPCQPIGASLLYYFEISMFVDGP